MRISDWSSDVCSADHKQAQAEESQGRRLGNLLQDKGCPGEGVVRDRQRIVYAGIEQAGGRAEETKDRKSTRLNSVTHAHLVCRLLLEKQKKKPVNNTNIIGKALTTKKKNE